MSSDEVGTGDSALSIVVDVQSTLLLLTSAISRELEKSVNNVVGGQHCEPLFRVAKTFCSLSGFRLIIVCLDSERSARCYVLWGE